MSVLRNLNLNSKNFGASFGASWWSTDKSHTVESVNPANEKIIATIYAASEYDYEQIVQKSAQTFLTWREMPAPKRGDIIRQIGEALRAKKSDLGSLVSLEMGKSKQEGDGEVQEMIDMADYAVGLSRMLYGKSMHSERKYHRMYEQWHPYGIVGVISAFNFPVAVWAWNAFIAAVCGNTVIWKPSPKTPLCTLAVQKICNDVMAANNCEGVFASFITEEMDLINRFVNDPRVGLISFTGSTAVGRKVQQQVAKRMGRSILECSGNNAIIVEPSADFRIAIPAIVFGAIGTAGQRCTSTRRVFIQHSIYDQVVSALIDAYKKITIGDPLNEKNLMGPLIDNNAVTNYKNALKSALKSGGKILYGGNIFNKKGYYVEPTLVEAENKWPIVQQETFAPILYLIKYTELDDAIAMQNKVEQGLSSAIFTTNLKSAEKFLSASGSDCGIANVNIGTSGAEIGGAFGGEKATGGGREAGSDSWKAYMRRQTNTINWSDELPLAQGIKFNI